MTENVTSPTASSRVEPTLLEAIVSAKVEAANERRASLAPASPRSRYGAASVIGFIELADDSDSAFVDAVAAAWRPETVVEVVDMTKA